MKYKLNFTGIMAATLITAMFVAFTSCNKGDGKEEEIDYSTRITGKWEWSKGSQEFILLNVDGTYSYGSIKAGGNSVSIEFNTDGTYSYESSNGNTNGNYRIYEVQKSEYMLVLEHYLAVDTITEYWEIVDRTYTSWIIVDGNIIYLGSKSMPTNEHLSGSGTSWIFDPTVIVSDTTYYDDTTLLKLYASGSSDFGQFWIYYSAPNIRDPQINVDFYANNKLVAKGPSWCSRGDLVFFKTIVRYNYSKT